MMREPYFGEGLVLSPLRGAPATVSPSAFAVCPVPVCARPSDAGWSMHDIYRLAYEQAQAALLPPWHDRLLRASSN
ncbi:MAG: hypothetical protein P4L84_32320 [Isosphaeraceae bacterium]|nr:hypothetical protein [Isosphaeraceae bacterium]